MNLIYYIYIYKLFKTYVFFNMVFVNNLFLIWCLLNITLKSEKIFILLCVYLFILLLLY